MKILVINGPNMNMLGIREPEIYGTLTYQNLVDTVQTHADEKGVEISFFQSNHEGDIVDAVQKAYFDGVDGIVINPAAYTHTSVAIADALKSVSIPTVEVHISDTDSREAFRQISYIREAAVHTIIGQGIDGYNQAVDFLLEYGE